jgi:hypothetical protein
MKDYASYTGMPVCPPELYNYALGLMNELPQNLPKALALAQSTNAENWVDQSYGAAWRVRMAQAIDRLNNPARTLFDPEAIEANMTPEVTDTDADNLALLTAYHPYGLPFALEAQFQLYNS